MHCLSRLKSLAKVSFHLFRQTKRNSSQAPFLHTPKVCVVGSGTSGIHAAVGMIFGTKPVEVDILDRFPVPFGSLRFNIKPDYLTKKECRFHEMSEFVKRGSARFLGNVSLGRDVTLKELREAYHIVILAYGADASDKFDVKGNDLKNVFNAQDFVGWCSGVPSNKDLSVDLSGTTATIFGHEDMAIEVANILLSPIDELKTTHITEHSLSVLSQSNIKEISLVDRRESYQTSFFCRELEDQLNLESCCSVRNCENICQSFEYPRVPNSKINVFFSRSPKEFQGNVKVQNVKLEVNKSIHTADEIESLDTSLIVNSLRCKSAQADQDIPFDEERGIVKHTNFKIDAGLYASGWLALGSADSDVDNMVENGFEVASTIRGDMRRNGGTCAKPGFEYLKKILDDRNVQVVSWEDYLKIDEFEKREGRKVNKPREKVVDIQQMLAIAAS